MKINGAKLGYILNKEERIQYKKVEQIELQNNALLEETVVSRCYSKGSLIMI